MIDYGFGLQLGPVSDADLDELRVWRNTPDIMRWCRQYEPLERWTHAKWLESLPSRQDVKMYSVFDECEPIGVAGLTSIDFINRHAEFSLYISPIEQGRGFGEKALKTLCAHGFLALGLHHIFGETFEGNPAARMFERVGFVRDGTRRGFYYRQGEFIDAHLYSILAVEFRSKWNI